MTRDASEEPYSPEFGRGWAREKTPRREPDPLPAIRARIDVLRPDLQRLPIGEAIESLLSAKVTDGMHLGMRAIRIGIDRRCPELAKLSIYDAVDRLIDERNEARGALERMRSNMKGLGSGG